MSSVVRPSRIISGGQTGADRGALDAAIALGIEHGGTCPRGRRAEDGVIPARYALVEIASTNYADRTEANVQAADATLLLSFGPLSGGSALTADLCRKHKKPALHLDLLALTDEAAAAALQGFLREHEARVVNVAGPRESGAPGISARVCGFLRFAFS